MKKIKLIGGVLILICCLLPFVSVKLGYFGNYSSNGFSLFNGNFISVISILLILGGAAALIYVDLVKEIKLAEKFTLSFVAKIAALAGGGLVFFYLISQSFSGVGIGLILEIIVAVALFFENKIIELIDKQVKKE